MRKRTWSEHDLKIAVKDSTSYRQVLMKLGLREAGGNYEQVKKYIRELGLDANHFKGRGWSKDTKFEWRPRISTEKVLVKDSDFQSFKVKKRLFKEGLKKEKCEKCGWNKRSKTGHLPLELHHINGNRRDHRIENLQILCPNCHSLEPMYRGRKNARVLE